MQREALLPAPDAAVTTQSHADCDPCASVSISPRAGRSRLSTAGNQALQRLFASGGIRPKLRVGSPDDPAEREADRMAEAAVREDDSCGCSVDEPHCPRCHAAAQGVIRRQAHQGNNPVGVDHLRLGTSHPLQDKDQSFFESRYNAELSGVRVHDNAEAASSARQLNARAFTLGSNIVFGRGEYRPDSVGGRLLLAHELAHVVQGHCGIRRQGNEGTGGASGASGAAGTGGAGGAGGAASSAAPVAFDPCAVVETELTNEGFLQMAQRVSQYLTNTPRGDGDYWAYLHLGRRLNTELQRRIRLGHLWLGRATGDVPQTLYALVPAGALTVDVRHVSAGAVRGAPVAMENHVVTQAQFDEFLGQIGVQTFDIEEVFAGLDPNAPQSVPVNVNPEVLAQRLARQQQAQEMGSLGATANPFFGAAPLGLTPLGTGALASPFSLEAQGAFRLPVGSDAGAWRGPLGTASFIAGQDYGLSYVNLDRRYESIRQLYGRKRFDFPIYDAYSRFGPPATRQAVSVGTRDVGPGAASGATPQFGTGKYKEGMQAMFRPTRPQLVDAAVLDLNALFNMDLDAAQLLGQSYMAVNADHVMPYRQFVEGDVKKNPGNYRAILDAHLAENPVTIGGTECRSVAAMEAARPRAPREFFAATDSLGTVVSERVISNGITTAELGTLLAFRQQYGAVGEEVMRWTPPELVDYARAGGGSAAAHDVSMRSAARAGALGAGIAGVGALYHMYSDWDQYGGGPLAGRAAVETALGGTSAALTGYAETRLGLAASELTLGAAQAGRVGSGAASALAGGSRVFVSGGAAAVVAPAVTALSLLYEEQAMGIHHSRSDYEALTARSAVSAGASAAGGALAAAGYGALAGSGGGPVGVLIGIGVGLIVFAVTDATLGARVESRIRESVERGCPR